MCVSVRLISAALLSLLGKSVPLCSHFSAWRAAQISSKALMEFPVCSFSHDNMAMIFLTPNASDVSYVDFMRFKHVTVSLWVDRPLCNVMSYMEFIWKIIWIRNSLSFLFQKQQLQKKNSAA